ncbi:MAG TPA: glycosyltransferase family 92 protein [Solirubrobacteraceae bacterium]|nr:glycosyltransferase family 92 protein [Solirubrobacteraceae bacterium]
MSAYLSICAIFKDEAPHLPEWIEFHRLVGVERFFLYDNGSGDAGREVVEPWVRKGVVSVAECSIPLAAGGQGWAYADALGRARGRTRWLAFIDVDEFLWTPGHAPLPDVLRDYEQHPGVVVNWQVYGSSGQTTTSEGLVIERFVRRARTGWVRNRRVKSIVDPQRAVRPVGPHFFEYVDGALVVTEAHEPVRVIERRAWTRRMRRGLVRLPLVETDPYAVRHSSVKRVSVERIRLHHYAVRSREEFEQKTARHGCSRMAPRYFSYHDRNEVHDPALLSYAGEVRARLAAVGDEHGTH